MQVLRFFLFISLVNVVWCSLATANQTPIHDQLRWMAKLKPHLSTPISNIISEYDLMLEKIRLNAGQDTDQLAKMMTADVKGLLMKISSIMQLFPDFCSNAPFMDAMKVLLIKSIEVMAVEFQFSTRYNIDSNNWLDRQMKVFELLIDPKRTRFGDGMVLISHLFARLKYILSALVGYKMIGGCELGISDYISIFETYLYSRFGEYLKRIYVDNRKDTYSRYAQVYKERTLDTDARRKKVHVAFDDVYENAPFHYLPKSLDFVYEDDHRLANTITENKKTILSSGINKTRFEYKVRPYAAIFDVYDDTLEFDGFRLFNDVLERMINNDRCDCAKPSTWQYTLIKLSMLRARLVKINLILNNYMDQREIEKAGKPGDLPDSLRIKVSNFHLNVAKLAEELAAGSSLRQRLITQSIVLHVPMLLSYHLTVGMERLVLRPEVGHDGDMDCKYGIKRLEVQNLIFKQLQSEQSSAFEANNARYIQTINIAKTWLLIQNHFDFAAEQKHD